MLPRCSTAGPLNVMEAVHRLLPVNAISGLRRVCNDAPAAPPPTSTQPRDALAGVRAGVLDWAVHIALGHAVRVAASGVPGIATLHGLYQLARSVSALQRGNLLHALQQLPVGEVLPFPLQRVLGEQLRLLLPDAISDLPEHDPVVLLLAAVLLAAEPHGAVGADARTPAPAWLAVLRASLEGLRFVRGLRSVAAAATHVRPAIAGPQAATDAGPISDGAGAVALTAPTGIEWALRHAAPASGSVPEGMLFSFGAEAATAGRKVATRPHVPRPKVEATPVRGKPSQPRRPGTLRRSGTRDRLAGEETAVQVRGNPASRNPASMVGHADGAKESLQSPLKHPLGKNAGDSMGQEREELPRSAHRGIAMGAHATVWQRGGPSGRVSVPIQPVVPDAVDPSEPSCLVVDDAHVAYLLVRQERYAPGLVRFCVPSGDVGWFEELFRVPAASRRGLGRWMVSETIQERPLANLTHALMRRYDGELDLQSPAHEPALHPLEGMRIFALQTMSLLDAPLQREGGAAPLQYMPRNAFRLLRHRGQGAADQLHLAYFLYRDTDVCSGVKGGFLEITLDRAGHFRVDDVVHGTAITAPTLGALAASISKLTGLRNADVDADSGAAPGRAEAACNLFVDERATLSTRSPGLHLPYEEGLDPFLPLWVEAEGHDMPVGLYFNSFVQLGDQILYADENGTTGILAFARHIVGGNARQLRCPAESSCAFAASLGLQRGAFYSPEHVMTLLEQRGLVWMMGPPASGQAAAGATSACGRGPAAETQPPAGPVALRASEFHFDDGDLHYVDHDGRPGLLVFDEHVGAHGSRFQLVDPGRSQGGVFAARHHLQTGVRYAEEEVVWRLHSQGFNRVPAAAD